MTDLVANAWVARQSSPDLDRVVIVIGDDLEAGYWSAIISEVHAGDVPHFWVERGRKGNLLGALQVYSALRAECQGEPHIDQILMLFGSGTRLSPFTQSLCNIKAAFPLPDGDRGHSGMTIAEAATRSSAFVDKCLRRAGFHGVIVTWGDEVLFPGSPADARDEVISAADVVRFGWRVDPNEELATQKEWLQVDLATNTVVRDISRQPLESLISDLASTSLREFATFVNLGSFAASHEFLSLVADAFSHRLNDDFSSANWDPYFWQALQRRSRADWDELVRCEQSANLHGLRDLLEKIPDFFEIVQSFRGEFERKFGRNIRIAVFDFGEPLWIDAGSHVALSRTFAHLFSKEIQGTALRVFLGLPDSLASGESYVTDSELPMGCKIQNSIVIGSTIASGSSSIERAVVLGSNNRRLVAGRGTATVWSSVADLRVEGPSGVAFRLDGDGHVVLGDESATTLIFDGFDVNLRYSRQLGPINRAIFERRLPNNPLSFSEASSLMRSVDPVELHRTWMAKLGFSGTRLPSPPEIR
jgi:hypothetical protein